MNSSMPSWMMRRGSKRSASAPAYREKQKRQPVRDHRETAQRRGMELLEHHPVADDVLDVVRHHGQHVGDELRPIGP